MPLSVRMTGEPPPMATGRIVFDKEVHAPGEPIALRLVVDDAVPLSSVTFTGTFTVQGQEGTATGTTQVGSVVEYGEVTAAGYTVVQDPADPARYTATPDGGAAPE